MIIFGVLFVGALLYIGSRNGAIAWVRGGGRPSGGEPCRTSCVSNACRRPPLRIDDCLTRHTQPAALQQQSSLLNVEVQAPNQIAQLMVKLEAMAAKAASLEAELQAVRAGQPPAAGQPAAAAQRAAVDPEVAKCMRCGMRGAACGVQACGVCGAAPADGPRGGMPGALLPGHATAYQPLATLIPAG